MTMRSDKLISSDGLIVENFVKCISFFVGGCGGMNCMRLEQLSRELDVQRLNALRALPVCPVSEENSNGQTKNICRKVGRKKIALGKTNRTNIIAKVHLRSINKKFAKLSAKQYTQSFNNTNNNKKLYHFLATQKWAINSKRLTEVKRFQVFFFEN